MANHNAALLASFSLASFRPRSFGDCRMDIRRRVHTGGVRRTTSRKDVQTAERTTGASGQNAVQCPNISPSSSGGIRVIDAFAFTSIGSLAWSGPHRISEGRVLVGCTLEKAATHNNFEKLYESSWGLLSHVDFRESLRKAIARVQYGLDTAPAMISHGFRINPLCPVTDDVLRSQ